MLQQGTDLLTSKLTNVLRASLALGHIPMNWRQVRAIFIPKAGRPSDLAKSFRPISLMSFILKTLEKLVDRHIRDGVLVNRPLHQDQYAYTTGKSTETALFQVVHRLEQGLENKEITLGAFLDIEGAFDNTSFKSIITAAKERGLDDTCCRWIKGMLKNRLVHSSLMGESLSVQVAGGCPQGGNLSPILWNLVVDGLLNKLSREGFHVNGYADDIVIMVKGKFTSTIRERMQMALNTVARWTASEGLNISPTKATIVSFTRRKKLDGIGPIYLHGEELTFKGEVKYLGVILDSKLTWNQHLEKVINKSVTTFAMVRRMYGKTWGLRPGMVHWVYTRVIRPAITYAAVSWWPKVMQNTAIHKLERIQRMACLGITGAIRTTPTASMEAILDLPPLDLIILGEARCAYQRLRDLIDLPGNITTTGTTSIWNTVRDPILEMRSDYMCPKYHIQRKFEVILDQKFWVNNAKKLTQDCLIWFTDGSKQERGSGAGVYGERPKVSISIPLGKHATVFQTEIYALLWCIEENIRRTYKNKQILIITDSQAALKALLTCKTSSRLVDECLQRITELAEHNRVKLVWVPGHSGIPGNEKADELARQGSNANMIGPEPSVGIPRCSTRRVTGEWINTKHLERWKTYPGNKHGKQAIAGPNKNKAQELLKYSRKELKDLTALLTGHGPVRQHLSTMKLFDDNLDCRLCGEEIETFEHIICECEALGQRRQTIFGKTKLVLKEIQRAPSKDLLHLVRETGIMDWCN